MKKLYFLFFIMAWLISPASAQVSINTDGSQPDNSAMLDVKSTTRGLLIPRLTETERNSISTPATGLLILQIDQVTGFYYYTGSGWKPLGEIVAETDPEVGTNTSGYSPKWDGIALVTGSVFQDATGNVGIGTTSPGQKLTVAGNAEVTNNLNVAGDVRFTKLVYDEVIGQIDPGASVEVFIESYDYLEGRAYIPMVTEFVNAGSSLKCEVQYKGRTAPDYNIDVYILVTNSGTSGTPTFTRLQVMRLR